VIQFVIVNYLIERNYKMFLFLFVISELENNSSMADRVEYIYNIYYGFVMQKLKKLLPECKDLNDLAHDVFLSMLKNKISVDVYDETALKKYLTIVCKNTASSYAKKNKRTLLMSSEEIDALRRYDASAEQAVILGETKDELLEIIMTLSEKNRDVCSLKYLSGLTNKEIAKTLGIPENIVASRLFKSRREIKVKYEKLKKKF